MPQGLYSLIAKLPYMGPLSFVCVLFLRLGLDPEVVVWGFRGTPCCAARTLLLRLVSVCVCCVGMWLVVGRHEGTSRAPLLPHRPADGRTAAGSRAPPGNCRRRSRIVFLIDYIIFRDRGTCTCNLHST